MAFLLEFVSQVMAEISAAKDKQEMLELRSAAKPPNPGEALAIAVARGEVLQKE